MRSWRLGFDKKYEKRRACRLQCDQVQNEILQKTTSQSHYRKVLKPYYNEKAQFEAKLLNPCQNKPLTLRLGLGCPAAPALGVQRGTGMAEDWNRIVLKGSIRVTKRDL